jgi:hypothetical protein
MKTRRRLKDNIRMDPIQIRWCDMDWINQVQNREQ